MAMQQLELIMQINTFIFYSIINIGIDITSKLSVIIIHRLTHMISYQMEIFLVQQNCMIWRFFDKNVTASSGALGSVNA